MQVRPVVVLLVCLGFVGCGTRTDPSRGVRVSSPAEDSFADRFAQAVCAASVPCCLEPATDCVEHARAFVKDQQSMAAARGSFDQVAAAACIDAYVRLLSSCPSAKGVDITALQDCNRVYPGSQPIGGTCGRELFSSCADPTALCEDGVCTQDVTPASCKACVGRKCVDGACVDLPHVGESCLPGGDSCAPGAVCGASGICQTPLPPGAACHERYECELWSCYEGTCVPPVQRWFSACVR